MDFGNKLASLLNRPAPQNPMGRPPPAQGGMPTAPLGSGMAQQAAQIMQSRPYQLHVQEMQSLGQRPLTPEEFMLQGQ